MTPRKLDILVATFSYGGNGGFMSEHPDVGRYLTKIVCDAREDERIGRINCIELADTPITMVRNRAVKHAIDHGYDCLLMIDSDMKPDCELGEDDTAKPFFSTAFDFLCDHYEQGPVVVGAPYCGPPPMSNCYQFYWSNWQNANQSQNFDGAIEAYSRAHAELLTGIQECAALPTGLILCDVRAFKLTDPQKQFERLIAQGYSPTDARRMTRPWFYYEYPDVYETNKASTEDVTATRDISYHGILELGYNPLFCAWDSWAGHHKPLCVRKPRSIKLDYVNEKYKAAVLAGVNSSERLMQVDFTQELEPACG